MSGWQVAKIKFHQEGGFDYSSYHFFCWVLSLISGGLMDHPLTLTGAFCVQDESLVSPGTERCPSRCQRGEGANDPGEDAELLLVFLASRVFLRGFLVFWGLARFFESFLFPLF